MASQSSNPHPLKRDSAYRTIIPMKGLPTKKNTDFNADFAFQSQHWIHVFDAEQTDDNFNAFNPLDDADIQKRIQLGLKARANLGKIGERHLITKIGNKFAQHGLKVDGQNLSNKKQFRGVLQSKYIQDWYKLDMHGALFHFYELVHMTFEEKEWKEEAIEEFCEKEKVTFAQPSGKEDSSRIIHCFWGILTAKSVKPIQVKFNKDCDKAFGRGPIGNVES